MRIAISVSEWPAEAAVPGFRAEAEFEGASVSVSCESRGEAINTLKQVVLRALSERPEPPMAIHFEVVA